MAPKKEKELARVAPPEVEDTGFYEPNKMAIDGFPKVNLVPGDNNEADLLLATNVHQEGPVEMNTLPNSRTVRLLFLSFLLY